MKNFSLLLSVLAALAFATGCSKQEPAPVTEPATPAAPAADAAKPATAPAVDTAAAQQAAEKAAADLKAQADAAQATAEKAAADLKAQADKAASTATTQTASITSKAQSLIETTQKLIADKNWSEALKKITELSAMQLTPDQQTLLASLKQQAEKLAQDAAASKASDQAGKAVSDLLKKK